MTHASYDTLPVFDTAALREVTEMANIEPAELIQIFLFEIDKNLPLLRNTLCCDAQEGDGLSLEHFSHSLKSSAANVGAMRIAAFARQLEATASSLAQAELLQQLDRLSDELERYRRIALS